MGILPMVRVRTHVDGTPSTSARARRSGELQALTLRSCLVDRSTGQCVEYNTHRQDAHATEQCAPDRARFSRLFRKRTLFGVLGFVTPYLALCAAQRWCLYPTAAVRPIGSSTWITDRDGNPLAEFVTGDGWSKPLTQSQVNPRLLEAIVAVEDGQFYEHAGVNWRSLAAAAWEDLTSLHFHRGASTITMQLHRLRVGADHSLATKLSQIVRARQIEETLSKPQILLEYVNRAPFGGNIVGAGAASERYFGKPCANLSLAQAALLAGLPQNPQRLRPDRFPQQAKLRRDHVLDRMLALNMINADEYRQAKDEPVAVRPLSSQKNPPALVPTLERLARAYPGRSIQSTIDPAIEQQASTAAMAELDLHRLDGVEAAAVVVLDSNSGDVLASVSICESSPSLDLTCCARSSGSAIKPFIYATAFEDGLCQPDSLVNDQPVVWEDYAPRNFDRRFDGTMPASHALAASRNIPAIQLLADAGTSHVLSGMRDAGLHSLTKTSQRYGLSLAIGGAEVTPMDLATAYATLARSGEYVPSRLTTLASLRAPRHCVSRDSAGGTLRSLSDADRTRQLCPEAAAMNVAWKTGTSSGRRDAWCAAVSRTRVVVVWMGNSRGEGSSSLVGITAAAPLALRLIAAIEPDKEKLPWWQASAAHRAANTREIGWTSGEELRILSPTPGVDVVRMPDLPISAQRIPLRAATSAAKAGTSCTCWWFVDDQLIGTAEGAETVWWSPSVGAHRIRVVDSAAHAAATNIAVR